MTAAVPRKVALRDVGPNRRQGGEFRFALTPRSVDTSSGLMGSLVLAPGEDVIEHYHPYSDECLFLVTGELVVRSPAGTIEVGPDECVLVPRMLQHRFENRGRTTVRAVVHLAPLAPRPELGHVDCEPLPRPDDPVEPVGGDT
jgi:putative monooxygenase